MILLGIGFLVLAAIVLIFASIFFQVNTLTVILPMSIFTFAAGVICPSSNAAAMSSLREKAGAANAVLGALLYILSSIMSTIATALSFTSLFPLAMFISAIALITLIGFMLMIVSKEGLRRREGKAS
jgi:hypothetical protein